jgi:hypothetical protein
MGTKKQGGPEEALDKTVGRVAEGAGRMSGDTRAWRPRGGHNAEEGPAEDLRRGTPR